MPLSLQTSQNKSFKLSQHNVVHQYKLWMPTGNSITLPAGLVGDIGDIALPFGPGAWVKTALRVWTFYGQLKGKNAVALHPFSRTKDCFDTLAIIDDDGSRHWQTHSSAHTQKNKLKSVVSSAPESENPPSEEENAVLAASPAVEAEDKEEEEKEEEQEEYEDQEEEERQEVRQKEMSILYISDDESGKEHAVAPQQVVEDPKGKKHCAHGLSNLDELETSPVQKTPAKCQGRRILTELMGLQYHIKKYPTCKVDNFLGTPGKVICPTLGLVIQDLLVHQGDLQVNHLQTGSTQCMSPAEIITSLLMHTATQDQSDQIVGNFPKVGFGNLPGVSPLSITSLKLCLPLDYMCEWYKVKPTKGEEVNTFSTLIPGGGVSNWHMDGSGVIMAILHVSNLVEKGPKKLWLMAPQTERNNAILAKFLYAGREHMLSAAVIPFLENIQHVLVMPRTLEHTAFFLAPGMWHCMLTLDILAHVAFHIYDVRLWLQVQKVMESDIKRVSGLVGAAEQAEQVEMMIEELDVWKEVGAPQRWAKEARAGLSLWLATLKET
ncbi:hypothetical protein DACRYDRAFT_18198 [Dacryopinax primogenitus]|uniref:Uncharacterized protein n=1 Tax=Dacryopinax primogenitus (strain DJM 731) TaxID=1858805 RepID=M5G2V9_DACPD|nr:uncharacterized protein DACRYDRAFT_18198 [Dacryopinax primogenitus]EJT98092.1 hypothetical protein DACRYDRAFT_18198 [Dacryopinax primogenitus]